MDWQTIREQYPHRWVVMEAPDAYIEDWQLIVNELEVVKDFGDDGSGGLKHTSKLLHENRRKHFVLYHTANASIYIKVLPGPNILRFEDVSDE
jgi:hypothetical protein